MEGSVQDSIESFQNILAKLYTSKEFRILFFVNREMVCGSFYLRLQEFELLKEIREIDVKLYSDTLISKRFDALLRVVPALMELIGETLQNKFREYASERSLIKEDKYVYDAINFIDFLLKRKTDTLLLIELKAILERSLKSKLIIIKLCRYDFDDLWDYDVLQQRNHYLFQFRLWGIDWSKKIMIE